MLRTSVLQATRLEVTMMTTTSEAAGTFSLMETSIAGVQRAYSEKELSARELVQLYLDRIEAYDRSGPALNSIITVHPDALDEADRLDRALATSGAVQPVRLVQCVGVHGDDRIERRAGAVVGLDAVQVELHQLAGRQLLLAVGTLDLGDGGLHQREGASRFTGRRHHRHFQSCGLQNAGTEHAATASCMHASRRFVKLLRRVQDRDGVTLSLIHISEPTRRTPISYA